MDYSGDRNLSGTSAREDRFSVVRPSSATRHELSQAPQKYSRCDAPRSTIVSQRTNPSFMHTLHGILASTPRIVRAPVGGCNRWSPYSVQARDSVCQRGTL
jgi:hypothetical protein